MSTQSKNSKEEKLTLKHVRGIKQCRNPQVSLANSKRKLVIPVHILRVEIVKVDEIGPEVMNDGAKPEPVSPRRGHVNDVDFAIGDKFAPVFQVFSSLESHFVVERCSF